MKRNKENRVIRIIMPGTAAIEEMLRNIPRGKLLSLEQIKANLKQKGNVDGICVKVLGIHLRLVAEAAEEEGWREQVPYWRVVKKDGSLNPKFPGGTDLQAKRLKLEGFHIVETKGKKPPLVKDFEKYLKVDQ